MGWRAVSERHIERMAEEEAERMYPDGPLTYGAGAVREAYISGFLSGRTSGEAQGDAGWRLDFERLQNPEVGRDGWLA